MSNEDFFLSIPKSDLPDLPAARFPGVVKVIDSCDKVDSAISDLRCQAIIGFDTETRPTFRKGQTNDMALMQLSTHQTCYLFRLNKIGIPTALISLLENPEIMKVGTSVHDDFHALGRIIDFTPENFVDLQQFVKQYKIADNSLSRICAIVFGERISKTQQKTNWEADELTSAQKAYAALDAYACIRIYEYLKSGAFHPEESKYRCYPQPEEESGELSI